jgi:hypothetical protein
VDDGLALKVSTTSLGTLATMSTVSSSEITDGSIIDSDLSSSAAISDAKLATIATAGKVSGSAITSGVIGGTTSVNTSGTLATSGNLVLLSASGAPSEIRFSDADNSNYIALKSPSNVSTNQSWILPASEGSTGQVLATNGSGVLSWTHKNEGALTYLATGNGISGGPITSLGTIQLTDTGVATGTYTRATLSVNSQGRIVSASSGGAISLTADIIGTLPVSNGGTGVTSVSANQFFAGPILISGAPGFRSLVSDDYPTMTGATSASSGTKGAVPAPSSGSEGKFLRGDGAWAIPVTLAVGSSGQIQFNSSGSLAASSGLTWDSSSQRLGVGTSNPDYTLHVQGTVAGVGSYVQLSDARFKQNVKKIRDSLQKIMALRGVTYKWIDAVSFGDQTNIGFIAQEIEAVIPEIIDTDEKGIKRVRYSELIPILVEAFKEMQSEMVSLQVDSFEKEKEIRKISQENIAIKKLLCEKFSDASLCKNGEHP